MIIPNPIKSINTIDRMLASGDFFMLSRFEQNSLPRRRPVRFAKSSRYRSAIPARSKGVGWMEGRMDGWKEEWKNGRMEDWKGWKIGRVEGWNQRTYKLENGLKRLIESL